MSVLLIDPPCWVNQEQEIAQKSIAQPSLGLAYLRASLTEAGLPNRLLDLNLHPWDSVTSTINEYEPKIVALTSMTFNSGHMINLAKDIKNKFPGIIIIVGGNFATYDFRELIKKHPIDFVIRHEGDRPFPLLCQAILEGQTAFRHIPNLVYREDKELIVTPLDPPIQNLDQLPFPEFEMTGYPVQAVPLLTARGCPFGCIYCSTSAYWGTKVRYRSLDNIEAEIKTHLDKGLRVFSLHDDTFNLNLEHCLGFCKMAAANGLQWSANCSYKNLSKSLLQTFKDSGCVQILTGIESADPDVQAAIGKKVDLQKAQELTRFAIQLGIKVTVGFILYHHCETEDSLQKTMTYGSKLKKLGATVRYSLNTPFKGTTLYRDRDELGITMETTDRTLFDGNHGVISTQHFTKKAIPKNSNTLNLPNINPEKILDYIKSNHISNVDQLSPEVIQDILKMVF